MLGVLVQPLSLPITYHTTLLIHLDCSHHVAMNKSSLQQIRTKKREKLRKNYETINFCISPPVLWPPQILSGSYTLLRRILHNSRQCHHSWITILLLSTYLMNHSKNYLSMEASRKHTNFRKTQNGEIRQSLIMK